MNENNIPGSGLKGLLRQMLKDDLPPEAEARMRRHFCRLESVLGRAEAKVKSPRFQWAHSMLRKEVLAFASAVMLIASGIMHLGGNQSVLAHSIGRVKIVLTVSAGLRRATSMDCTVLKPGDGDAQSSFHLRWTARVATRVDMEAGGRGARTLWIPDASVSTALYAGIASQPAATAAITRDVLWQPALEYLTPVLLARHIEERYGLIETERRSGDGVDELLLVGQENGQAIELAVDEATYLPLTLKKYRLDPVRAGEERRCVEEVRFRWNQPIPRELFFPKYPAENRPVHQ
jgi:hypothetical protein